MGNKIKHQRPLLEKIALTVNLMKLFCVRATNKTESALGRAEFPVRFALVRQADGNGRYERRKLGAF